MVFPVATRMAGMAFAFPDTCQTPDGVTGTVPIPYPNIAQNPMANAGTCSMRVKVLNQPVLLMQSMISRSNGDEPGVAGGVVSGVFGDAATVTMGSETVMVEGRGAAHFLSPTAHNGSNANAPSGTQVVPSQATVLVM